MSSLRILQGFVDPPEINHAVNGVLLSKEGNLALGNKAPDLYLKKILDESSTLTELELRARVESHLVPYDALISTGNALDRYESFVKRRAKLLADEIAGLVEP